MAQFTVTNGTEALAVALCAERGDMVLTPDYRTQEVVQEALESVGFGYEEVHTLAQVAGDEAAGLTDWLNHVAEGGI